MAIDFKDRNEWGLILGGSSGIGLAAARKLASCGMNLFVVHRDLRGEMERIDRAFDEIRGTGIEFWSLNANALTFDGRSSVMERIERGIGKGKIRLLLHSVAAGALKLFAPHQRRSSSALDELAMSLEVSPEKLRDEVDHQFAAGSAELVSLASRPMYGNGRLVRDEDLAQTIYNMGTSLLSWVQDLHGRELFTPDARVLGLTSEGSTHAIRGYGAVSAAKAALEAIARSIAVEYAPYGIRCNVLQAGVTDTPALRVIPGSVHLKAHARLHNPFGRLTCPDDVANMIALMCTDEAAWVNGSIIRVDGGEYAAG